MHTNWRSLGSINLRKIPLEIMKVKSFSYLLYKNHTVISQQLEQLADKNLDCLYTINVFTASPLMYPNTAVSFLWSFLSRVLVSVCISRTTTSPSYTARTGLRILMSGLSGVGRRPQYPGGRTLVSTRNEHFVNPAWLSNSINSSGEVSTKITKRSNYL